MKLSILFVALAFSAMGVESHVDAVVNRVLAEAAKVKTADPEAVPMAFWDMDGTIIKGDCSEGLIENVVERYKGSIESMILDGLCTVYRGPEGWKQYRDVDYPRLNEFGRWIAWPFNAQIFHGQDVAAIDAYVRRLADTTFRKWYFVSSVEILRRLEKAGVENHIVSASPHFFVEPQADVLGLSRSRMNGIRVGIDGGRITTRIEHPVPYNEGKVETVRRIVNARAHGVAVAGFGNSYSTDGPFLRYIVTQSLPGGAKGFALMINGNRPPAAYEGLFMCVTQDEVCGNGNVAKGPGLTGN